MHAKSKRSAASHQRHNNNNLAYSDAYLSPSGTSPMSTPSEPAEPESEPPMGVPHFYSEMTQDTFHHEVADLLSHEAVQDVRSTHLRVAGDSSLSEGPVHVGSPSRSAQSTEVQPPVSQDALQPTGIMEDQIAGHVRPPVLTREPTALEAFSRTIRTYVPSSIAIPSATPSPPRVSRPVSFGSFLSPSSHRGGNAQYLDKHRGSDARSDLRPTWAGLQSRKPPADGGVFNLDEEVIQDRSSEDESVDTRYPGVEYSEDILWAGWDTLLYDSPRDTRRMLLLGYRNGFQMWDCSNLGSVSEVLNLSNPEWGAVLHAQILPQPTTTADDEYAHERPLVGIMTLLRERTGCHIYSLTSHKVVKRLSLDGLSSFQASADFVVLSTAQPTALHILSSRTFASLYVIPSSSLVSIAHPPTPPAGIHPDVSLELEQSRSDPHSIPGPVFALSHRLLALASPLHDSASSISRSTRTISSTSPTDATSRLGLTMTQADISNAAARLGGSVLSSMRSLGGMAISAARAGVAAAMSNEDASNSRFRPNIHRTSRSAPAESGSRRVLSPMSVRSRRESFTSQEDSGNPPRRTRSPQSAPTVSGCTISILDLRPLLSGDRGTTRPERVGYYAVSDQQAITSLKFSDDGASIVAAVKDGQFAQVFRLTPRPRPARTSSYHGNARDDHTVKSSSAHRHVILEHEEEEKPQQSPLYTLRRGRTLGVIEGIDWLSDGRWFAMGSRKRTIHVFAVNPYGGPVDEASHLSGKVINTTELPRSPTDLGPIIRLRTPSPHAREQAAAPLAFTFIQSTDATLPSSLLPPATMFRSSYSSPAVRSPSTSPNQRPRQPTNFQDILVFDPIDACLSLRRIYVERNMGDNSIVLSNSVPVVGGASISLPGMSTLNRLGTSPHNSHNSPAKTSVLTQMIEKPTELIARENQVGNWQLGRGRDWPEIRNVLHQSSKVQPVDRPSRIKDDLLSHAELSTFSTASQVLPRSLYLSHQFAFHAFGEDYHALIRSYHFDVPTSKLEVRKQVEVSAYPTGDGESFVQGRMNTHDHGGISVSFDESLALALSAEMNSLNPSPPTIPMLPNGTSGSMARSLKNSIPIRSVTSGISDGMSEGLVRLRREFGRVRPHKPVPHAGQSLPTSVPLEFDEEDEDFLGTVDRPLDHDQMTRSTSREGDSGASISTPSTNIEPLPVEEEGAGTWQGWGPEDQQAIDDAERFEDVSAVGFMDEEQASMREVEQKKVKTRRPRRH